MEDLEKIANIYGIHPAALLMAPDEAERVRAMQEASEIARKMPADAVKEWIAVGSRMLPKDAGS